MNLVPGKKCRFDRKKVGQTKKNKIIILNFRNNVKINSDRLEKMQNQSFADHFLQHPWY